jgi:hypothetical protein
MYPILRHETNNMCSGMKEPGEGVVQDVNVEPGEFHVASDEVLKNVMVLVASYMVL